MNLPNINLSPEDQQLLEQWAKAYQENLLKSLKPKADDFGMRQLPREPNDPNKFLSTFKTDAHTYQIIGEHGIGFQRYTAFQKRSLARAFGKDFQQIYNELQAIKLGIAGDGNVGKMRSDAIIHITGLQDSIADFGKEQFEAALWLCTLFVLREDETVAEYSEQIAEEKIKDWANFGFSELDFFFLSGSVVPGYGSAFREAITRNEKARQKLLDAIGTNGSF